ncbi:MAG: LysR family transcriptional regulator, partial [Xanthobacteraceae bacterium]|nr:LysR family transcriptional regulator [Xanthobacteraceae bacterium]
MQRRPPTGNIPIELLRAVVAIVDLGSFSKAAQALRLTQPAISAQMRRLKQLVGTEVFSKAGSTLVLTDRGALIVKYARRILAMNDQILSLGGGPVQCLRLGLPFVFTPTILSDVLQIEGSTEDETEVQVFCDSSDELRRRLAAGYLDIAFLISPQDPPAQVVTQWMEPWVWVCAPGLSLSTGDTIPLIVTPTDRHTIEAVEKAGQPYVIRFVAPSVDARIEAMLAGVGIMTLPERLVTDRMKIVERH